MVLLSPLTFLFLQGLLRSCCVNEELIKSGLAKVKHLEGLASDRTYIKFSDKLIQCELHAAKKGKGVWKSPPVRDQVKTYFSEKVTNLTSPITRLFNSFTFSVTGLFNKFRRKEQKWSAQTPWADVGHVEFLSTSDWAQLASRHLLKKIYKKETGCFVALFIYFLFIFIFCSLRGAKHQIYTATRLFSFLHSKFELLFRRSRKGWREKSA